MWHLQLSSGVFLSEGHVPNWDAVPPETEIQRAALVLATMRDSDYVIDLSGYDRYCIAKVASSAAGAALLNAGYCLYGQRGDIVTELEVLPTGMHIKSYSISRCELPDACWRRGCTNV